MNGVRIPDPRGGLVLLHGKDPNGEPRPVACETDGRVKVVAA